MFFNMCFVRVFVFVRVITVLDSWSYLLGRIQEELSPLLCIL